MAQGLLKGLAAGIAVSAGVIVISSQTLDDTTVSLAPAVPVTDETVADSGFAETATADGTDAGIAPEGAETAETAQDAPASDADLPEEAAAQPPDAIAATDTDDAPRPTTEAVADALVTDADSDGDSGPVAEVTTASGDTEPETADVDEAMQAPSEEAPPAAPVQQTDSSVSDDTRTVELGEAAGASTPVDDALAQDEAPQSSPGIGTFATTALDDVSIPDVTEAVGAPAAPTDEAAPTVPGATDPAPVLAEGAAPIAPVADVPPGAAEVAPPVEVADTPSLAEPSAAGEDMAAAPDTDEPILPVPESLPPPAPAADAAPAPADAPRRAQEDPETITGGADGPSDVAPSALIDGDRVSERAALETAVRAGDRPAGTELDLEPEVERAPDPTGRDRVRVNRLAQITPPEPEPEAATDSEEGGAADSADATEEADPDPILPPEDLLLSEDAMADDTDTAEADTGQSTRPSSNLIERRLRAVTGQSGDSGGQGSPDGPDVPLMGDGQSGPALAALAPEPAAQAPSRAPDATPPKSPPSPEIELTGVAMDDFDQPFDNSEGLPLVSVVLLDYGGPLIDLPLPLSVALDAGQPKVAARAATYRAQGYEVLVIPSLPRGAAAQDVEQAMQASLGAVEGAVAVLPDPSSDVQGNRAAIDTLVGRLGDSGLGLVSFPQGLNRAQQVAARENVPAGVVFRQIDGDGQDLRAVKRFLDQAAFRARQENAVILVGRNRPETRGALMEWRLGNRAESVRLAPVTAAIRALSP